MAVVTELFRSEDNGTLSFGDYTLAQKAKKGDIQFEGDIYLLCLKLILFLLPLKKSIK